MSLRNRLVTVTSVSILISALIGLLTVKRIQDSILTRTKDSLYNQAVLISLYEKNPHVGPIKKYLQSRNMFIVTLRNKNILFTSLGNKKIAKSIIAELDKEEKTHLNGADLFVYRRRGVGSYNVVKYSNVIIGQALQDIDSSITCLYVTYILGCIFTVLLGTYCYYLLSKSQVQIQGINNSAMEAVTRELSERKRVEVILSNLADGIIVIDSQGRINMINVATERLLGISSNNVIDLFFEDIISNNGIKDYLRHAIVHNASYEATIVVDYPIDRVLKLYSVPLMGSSGYRDGILVVVQDITKLRKLEQIRKDFVVNVSHELRTPITSIKAMAETLLGGALNDEEVAMKFLYTINNESDRLSRLIDDLLTLSKIESQNVSLNLEMFSCDQLIKDVILQLSSKAAENSVFVETKADARVKMVADKDKFKQILFNLIDNAIVHSGKGSAVNIAVSESTTGGIELVVEDDGVGIPVNDQERIFERFYRVDKARSRQQGGMGLGLSIVKHIVELHRGNITVVSKEGKGTRFEVNIPNIPNEKV